PNGSKLVTRLLSDGIIKNYDNIPEESYDEVDLREYPYDFDPVTGDPIDKKPKDLLRSELYGLVEALEVLKIEVIDASLSADNMTVSQLRELVEITAYIIRKMVSDTILDTVNV